MGPLIQAYDYKRLFIAGQREHVLIDARSGSDAAEKYMAMHLKGALHADLDHDLSNISEDAKNGGRHPLPATDSFAFLLGQLGIGPDTHVVVYDDKSGANAAARFWWMLRATGHAAVQVLDGGYEAALRAGIPGSLKAEMAQKNEPYLFGTWKLPIASMEQVQKASTDDRFLIIDVREAERYRGETEPYDIIAGHIPGAVNIPYHQNLDRDGFFHPPKYLREHFLKLTGNHDMDHVIVHCGSGVTACHTLLALDHAGLGIPALYTGSYSEWIRNNKPIITQKHGNC